MKTRIAELVDDALSRVPELDDVPERSSTTTTVERARDPRHGDFATNIAMRLAKSAGRNPRDLAAAIIEALDDSDLIEKVDVAGPGFINFFVSERAFHEELQAIIESGAAYGRQATRESPRILLEFVSANPTGPLHVGHGRHAAFGATLGNLLEAAGYNVDREYYVNDAGRQMDILGLSVLIRGLEAAGQNVSMPRAGYQGDYIRDIAADTDIPAVDSAALTEAVPDDADDDREIDALIRAARAALPGGEFDRIRRYALESIRQDIEADLEEFGVTFDRWYSEESLTTEARIDAALAVLRERRMLYEKDGAQWFRATDYGDEKDRVVVRADGNKTYFASDIAYHFDKRERGYDHLIDVLGADHHGYVARVRAGLEAMGYAGDSLEVPFVQFVSLFRGGRKQSMSTRSGEFVTLRQLREEVGRDAARFFYVMRSNDQHLDFDLDLARERSSDNPVYYIQYAHARVQSVFRQLEEKNERYDASIGLGNLGRLTEAHEKSLMSTLTRYPEVIELAATNRAPQNLVHYLRDLANEFHTYYNAHTFLVDDDALRNARLTLISAARTVIASGLSILGVSAPDTM
ncbi:MAG: arginine--tRNA ligase [Woeseiaceae bacterium]|nr:arginine--tRNA ligase [Woeseiaceae bacterium]